MAKSFGPFCALHTIEIDASAEAIWREINNFDNWENWNPLYAKSSGSFAVGNTLEFAVVLPGIPPNHGQATVLTVDKDELVQYQILGLGGLVKATRFIEIEQTEPGKCRVYNGEKMRGLLGPLLYLVIGGKVRQGLQGMNEALKKRLEARSP